MEDGLEDKLNDASLEKNDKGEVQWQHNAEQHPRNWRHKSKLYTVTVVIWLEFFMTAISSSGAATADGSQSEYGLSTAVGYFAFLTMYLLGQTIGSIACSPISEVFGRRTIYAIGSGVFCIGSIIVAAPVSSISVFFGRFIQGVAAAIPATVAFGNFEDMYDAHHRIIVVYGYTFWGISGLSIGPIFSTYITMACGWRWVYWISAIASAISALACLFIKESNANQLLEAAVKEINKKQKDAGLRAATPHNQITFTSFTKENLMHPLRLLFTEPIVFFCSALCAIAFALIYGLTEALTIVYTLPPFDETFTKTSSSLSFIALIIGQILNVLPRIYDYYLLGQYPKEKKRILPETKIASLVTSCPALALGLWIFAWTVPPVITDVPWAVSMIGLIGVGYATNDLSYVLFGYATDSYGQSAASAVSAISLTRTLAAGALPLFTTPMYEGLGANRATTIFAALATAFCITPWLFLRYGQTLRERSNFCSHGNDVLSSENKHMKDLDEKSSMSRDDNEPDGEGQQNNLKKSNNGRSGSQDAMKPNEYCRGLGEESRSPSESAGSGSHRYSRADPLSDIVDSWTQT